MSPAMIETMMYVGETPWHGLGIKMDNPTIEEAIVAAGLTWNVNLKPLFLQSATGEMVKAEGAQASVRDSDDSLLGIVGPNYNVLQNSESFKFFQPFLNEKLATLETAGSIKNGRRVFVLAKINKDPMKIVGDDTVEKYILLSNSHDGTMAVRVGFTPIRVVCNNTLVLAHNSAESKLIRVRHSSQLQTNLDALREVMNLANNDFEATAEQYRFLASKEINQSDLVKYIKMVVGVPASEFNTEKGNRVLADVIPLFERGRGNDLPGVKGTYWAAYNAFNEYLGYFKGRNQDNRLDSLWFGPGAESNRKALTVATAMAKAA